MSKDLISRSEAEKLGATCLAKRNENGQLEAVISLDNAPTVEPQMSELEEHFYHRCGFLQGIEYGKGLTRPTGEWIGDTDYESYQGSYEAYKCSNCNYGVHWRDYFSFAKDYNYCPNCGAKMKGGAEREDSD